MKIGIVVPKLSGGGAEYVAVEWGRYLSSRNMDVVFCLTDPDSTVDAPDYTRAVALEGKTIFSRIWALRRFLLSEETDVVIGLMPFWNLLSLAAVFTLGSKRPRVLISSHTIESAYGVSRGRGFLLQTTLAKVVYRFADGLIASSHAVAAEAVARYGIRREKLWVVPNPVFPKPVAVKPRPSNFHGPLTLLVPGRIVDQKRPDLAVEVAVEIGKQTGTTPCLVFIGEGPAEESTRERALASGVDASFAPWTPAWPSLAKGYTVVLLPSMLEGFGNVILDATAAQLPVVVSSRALGVADAIIPGVTGVLVEGDEISDYVKGILESSNCSLDLVLISKWLQRFTTERSGGVLSSILARLMLA
ncbi:glycosyltransferase involved in cell wall biosynthesis [Arthrobacter sp. SLBN-83]|uniref:glycosyltransferase n=1 Tax=Arthrobacter sp. SLBN-83 TaxID=2768449 RepID=UPI00114D5239|nr:glycosyltransferase [Arthrobacter sp. SLBN-83]TQJ59915.1 glycosyltransferase involved in cell wall biosynthesis [Arthrobacter sp. SLBN-83]